MPSRSRPDPLQSSVKLEETAELLRLVQAGDPAARERLVRRYLPILQAWARGRLPGAARDLAETDDIVQIALLKALDRVGEFEQRREGAFLAYLRTILLNSIRSEIRRTAARPTKTELDENLPDLGAVVGAAGQETVAAYEAALATLSPLHQEAIILRVEFGFTYGQIAQAIESPSAEAARMLIRRALVRLAEAMRMPDEEATE